jgi:hypothetical protein
VERTKYIAALALLNALTLGATHLLAAEIRTKAPVQKNDPQAGAHSTNPVKKTNTEWVADPERGWVRVNENEPREEEKSATKIPNHAKVLKHY